MNPVTLIVCAFGTCFNPSQITYMETQHISNDCVIYFSKRGSSSITVEGHPCEDVSKEINKQIVDKTAK